MRAVHPQAAKLPPQPPHVVVHPRSGVGDGVLVHFVGVLIPNPPPCVFGGGGSVLSGRTATAATGGGGVSRRRRLFLLPATRAGPCGRAGA